MTIKSTSRIESIDVLRGLAMVIMALDHVRDFFHVGAFTDDPLNLATTTPLLFFTRWITHFCAPVFVFLSGTSIYLQSFRKSKKELSLFLFKRGIWLIAVEFTIIAFAWTFNPHYNFIPLQVLWAIGISMVILGFVIHLPNKLIFVLGAIIVAGHNLLDIPESAPGFKAGFWWELLHHGYFSYFAYIPDHFFVIIYPFVPWTGLMLLGYCAGQLYKPEYSAAYRSKILFRTGLTVIILFVALRLSNIYGDPFAWSVQSSGVNTFFSFIKVHKYPPSLLYLCMTIGPALILLSVIENIKNRFTSVMVVFGRTAFFYYILHFFLIHAVLMVVFYAMGNTTEQALNSMKDFPFLYVIKGSGFGLGVVYSIWVSVIISLYPLCRWYDHYKTTHKSQWWLSYL